MKNRAKIPVVVIIGPTGVGKSRTALYLARKFPTEIISADSMQIYKYMDIGTDKPSPEVRQRVPHHMIDVVEPDEPYSAARYSKEAREKIFQVWERGNLPLLVGGSGLYIRAVIEGIFPGPGANYNLRKKWLYRANEEGVKVVYRKLKEVDPETASRIHPHDLRRIVRALEVWELTGTPISHFQKESATPSPLKPLIFGLNRERKALYAKLEGRVEEMFDRGLVEEVRGLLRRGYNEELPSLQGVGYKEVIGFLKGKYGFEEAKRLVKRNTRRLAKKQWTWFGKDSRIHWLNLQDDNLIPAAEFIIKEVSGRLKKEDGKNLWGEKNSAGKGDSSIG